MNEEAYMYDIFLDKLERGSLVGTNGDLTFDTKEEAQADADDYIISELSKEYNAKVNEFRVQIYLGRE